MFSKQVVLTMIILIGITSFAGTTTSAETPIVCTMNSDVATVVTDEIVAGLPVPVNLSLACLNTLPAAQGTVQITTTNLQVANSSTNPALLILNGIAYQGLASGNILTFDGVPVPNGAVNYSVNFSLDPANGTPYVPIVATGTVSTSGTTATSGATVAIFGQSGNDATGIVDVNNLKFYDLVKFGGDTYATSWSVIQPVAGGNHYLSLDNAQNLDNPLLTSSPRARFDNLSHISQWTNDRYLYLVKDFRWSRDSYSYAGIGVFDRNDQPNPSSSSFEATRIILNSPLSSTNATQAVAGAVLPALYETQLYANLNFYALNFYPTLQIGGLPVTRNSALGGSSVDVCENINSDAQCTTNFVNYQFQSMVLNGGVVSTVKNGLFSLPLKYRVQLNDLKATTPSWDMTWNMNISGEVKAISTTSMDSKLRLNGFAKGSFTMQGNSTPYELKKFDFLVRLNQDRTTGSTTYNARGWTYNSCTGSVVKLRATNIIFNPLNFIAGGELGVNNAIDSINSVDALFNPNGDGKVQISFQGSAPAPTIDIVDINDLLGGCLIPAPQTNVFIQSLDLTFTSLPTSSIINVTGSISTTSTTGNASGATVHLTLTGGQTAAVTTDVNGNFSASFTVFVPDNYTVTVTGVDPPSGEGYAPLLDKISSVMAFVN